MDRTKRSKLWYYLMGIATSAMLLVYACQDTTGPANQPPTSPGVSFNILSSSIVGKDTVYKLRVSWAKPSDGFGDPEYYLHTMTASKTVTDSTTGPLPANKRVDGLSDTVSIKVSLVNDTTTLTSNLWSVRRGLQSVTPAVGRLFIRRGDRPPPPPDSIKVDTLVIRG